MYSDILSAIASAIRSRYANLSVLTEYDAQELAKPCITVGMEKNSFTQGHTPYYEAGYTFALNYYPSGSTQNADRGAMSEALYELTEMLSLADGTKLRGTGMSSEVKDGVLKFSVSYTVRLKGGSDEEDNLMTNLTVEEGFD
ncbi:MAG: hypothetical protein VB119_04275 [Candidatus Metalachnospira sp.]|nr:hypothetical protein [Candidatus Metalachnospira sp.]